MFALDAQPASADGGQGGFYTSFPGGAGGAGFTGNPGQAPSPLTLPSGGGGGGAGGGAGGTGGNANPGGDGGTSGSPNGQDGNVGPPNEQGGGGGGGGGFNGNGAGAASIANSATLTGGNGGNGGTGPSLSDGGGGGGGAGGYGAIVTGTTASSNNGTIAGGTGGAGGVSGSVSGSHGGNGGDGGVGVQFTASGATFANTDTVAGGSGGVGGAANGGGTFAGANGAGGAGIVGSGLSISNLGTISGGLGGNGTTRANAITFTGGANTLTLQGANWTLTGNIGVNGGGSLTFNQAANQTLSNAITGNGSVIQNGLGTLALSGASSYSGGTTISSGTLALSGSGSIASSSGLTLGSSGAAFDISASSSSQTINDLAGTAGTIVNLGANTLTAGTSNSTTFAGAIQGTGGLVKQGTGTLTLSGTNSYSGGTTVIAGGLLVNGSLSSPVTVASGGLLGGSGTITGSVTNNGTVQPGDTFVTLNINGTYTQGAGGLYAPSVNAAGQSDRIAVTGNANLAGTVAAQASNGSYGRSTTYTILTATGTITGTFSSVTSNLAFLTPTLSYDAHDVFLTLLSGASAFAAGAQTGNQKAVGAALDRANASASGDFNTVLNALYGLSTTQGPKALDAISGQSIADFGTTNIQTGAAFMNTIGAVLGGFHGGLGGGTHVSMAAAADDACDFACDAPEPQRFGAWLSGVGGTGTVSGDGNAGTLTYNLGGTAVGADYAVTPQLRIGAGAGYVTGTQWVGGFDGRGTTDAFSGFLYASYTPSALYVDGLAGYASSVNRSTRIIAIPGLVTRTAQGTTGANQFLGQVETGYKIDLPFSAPLAVTPFVRLQGSTTSQNGFTETGADSLDLTVAEQTTNSLRTTLGADFAAEIEKVDVAVRLGWEHEHADTGRPMTASFAGAPGNAFTVTGATPQRDSAVVGFALKTHVAEATELYARYDGEVGGGSASHALTAGLRMTW